MDPNSQHQIWSNWVFTVFIGSNRLMPLPLFRQEVRRWLRHTFRTSMGKLRVTQIGRWTLRIECHVEGIPAHDPGLVAFVREQFQRNFVAKGFGPLASSTVTVTVIAGDQQDGKPRAQLLVLPSVRL